MTLAPSARTPQESEIASRWVELKYVRGSGAEARSPGIELRAEDELNKALESLFAAKVRANAAKVRAHKVYGDA